MRFVRLIGYFLRSSAQQEMAYRTNFLISLLHSLLNLATGVLGLLVLFGQVRNVQGWSFASALALLGVYLLLNALRELVIGPSLEALAGLGGEVWTGRFDFTLLRPVDTQFLVSLRYWRLFKLIDLALAVGVISAAWIQLGRSLSFLQALSFISAMLASLAIFYAILLIFAGLVFWSPGFLFTWVFDALYQMARYPVGLYPGWLRLVLTWVVPVGMMTTIPAQALAGSLPASGLAASLAFALGAVLAGSLVFRKGLQRYASASS